MLKLVIISAEDDYGQLNHLFSLNFFSQQIDPPKYLQCKIMFYCSLSTIKYFFFDIEHQLVIVMKAHVMQMAGRIRNTAKNIQLVWGNMAHVRISYAMISVYFYLVSFEWIAGDSISKENKQRNKMIFGISSCIPSLLLFSVLVYLAILKDLPPCLIPTLLTTARSILHTFN